ALLGHLKVVVREFSPEETLRLAFGRGILIVLQEFCCTQNQSLRAGKQPAIRWRESGKFCRNSIRFQEAFAETGHVPQLRDQFGPHSNLRFTNYSVLTKARTGRTVAH